MISFKRLDHLLITIPTGKKEEARRFYKDVLQLKEIPGAHPNGALWFEIGDIQLHIREETESASSCRHPAFEVEDLELAKINLRRHGIELSYSSEIIGRERLFFHDPFGNRFELLAFKP